MRPSPMVVLKFWIIAAVGILLLQGLNRLCLRLRWPAFPWRLPSLALLSWVGGNSFNWVGTNPSLRLVVAMADDLLLAVVIIRLLIWLVLELFPKLRLLPATPKILRDLLLLVVSALVVVVLLQQRARVDLLGLVTTSAVLTAIFGLAAQEPLKDLIGGLSLQLEQVINEGDWIEVEGLIGKVTSVTWRDTELRCVDGSKLTIPNNQLTTKSLRNFTQFGPYGNRLFIGLDYSLAPAQAKSLLLQLARQHPLVLQNPPPVVRIAAFDDSSIRYELLAWQADYGQMLGLRSDLMAQLWYLLRRHGQTIPYPIQDLRVTTLAESAAIGAGEGQNGNAIAHSQQLELLQKVLIFDNLADSQLEQLIETSQCHSYGPGEAVVREGEQGESLFLVSAGEVEVTRRLANGGDITITQLHRGEIFGEMTLCTGECRSATVRATRESQLLEIKREAMAALLQEDPGLLESFSQLVSQRQAEINNLESEAAAAQQQDLMERMRRLFSGWMQ